MVQIAKVYGLNDAANHDRTLESKGWLLQVFTIFLSGQTKNPTAKEYGQIQHYNRTQSDTVTVVYIIIYIFIYTIVY